MSTLPNKSHQLLAMDTLTYSNLCRRCC